MAPRRTAGSSSDSWYSLTSALSARLRAPIFFLAAMWVVFLIQKIGGSAVWSFLGVHSHSFSRPWTWLTSPFIHVDLLHLLGNTAALIVLGPIVAAEGLSRWLWVTVLGSTGSSLFATFLSFNTVTGGASGVVFAYFAYLLAAVVTDQQWGRKLIRVVVAVVIISAYGSSILLGFIPNEAASWQGHLGGFIGGILAAFICRSRPKSEPTHIS